MAPPLPPSTEITIAGITRAAEVVDPLLRNSPVLRSDLLEDALGARVLVKVETLNPIRCFKGRGTDHLLQTLADRRPLVCASTGNFALGLAYAARRHGRKLHVFVPRNCNPVKLARLASLGFTARQEPGDFDAVKAAARRFARDNDLLFVEDGREGPLGEGAGTIAVELLDGAPPLDALVAPVGNGSLINGIGTWLRHASPKTRLIGVCATGAPAMARSWESATASSTDAVDTIADGLAVREPVPEAVDHMRRVVDRVVCVDDADMIAALRTLFDCTGLIAEPSGAAALAGLSVLRDEVRRRRVAVIVTGSNVPREQLARWLAS